MGMGVRFQMTHVTSRSSPRQALDIQNSCSTLMTWQMWGIYQRHIKGTYTHRRLSHSTQHQQIEVVSKVLPEEQAPQILVGMIGSLSPLNIALRRRKLS